MTVLILMRHGETEWNVIGRYQGQADPPLNETGLEQARVLGRALEQEGLDVIYASPLRRAAQTAEMIGEHLDVPIKFDERLKEIHQGRWQTRLRSEIEALYPDLFRLWETKPWEATPPGGEHLREVQKRVYKAVDEIVIKDAGKVIGLVAHRIPLALLKMRYQGLSSDSIRTLHLPNTYWEKIEINSQ